MLMRVVDSCQSVDAMEVICRLDPILEGLVCADGHEGFELRDSLEPDGTAGRFPPGEFVVEDVEDGDDVAEAGADVDVAECEGDQEHFEGGGGGGEGEEHGEHVVDAGISVDYYSFSRHCGVTVLQC